MTWWDRGEAALNAVVGDYLHARGNDLAIEMGLYHRGRPLAALPETSGRLCVLLPGMGLTERCWAYPEDPDTDFGALLERDHGLTPLYVRYNTGLPIWQSGQQLSALLQSVVEGSPQPVKEITLIGHSLGGLVIRSACHHGKGQAWLPLVRRAFYLGTPHLGAPLEKAGHIATTVLHAIEDPVVQLLGDLAEIRSAAVKDLRHGDLVESREAVPLDERIEHFQVAGSLRRPFGAVLGDGMVRVPSATGAPGAKTPTAAEREDRIGLFPGLHHMALLHDPQVYAWISQRCGPTTPTTPVEPILGDAAPPRRLRATLELIADAIGKGASAVQGVHEAIAARPYDILEMIPPLEAPTRAARKVHFTFLRGTYTAIRQASALADAVVRSARAAK